LQGLKARHAAAIGYTFSELGAAGADVLTREVGAPLVRRRWLRPKPGPVCRTGRCSLNRSSAHSWTTV